LTALAHPIGWSLAASMATALAVLVLRDGRRRSAINEAMHELRRPLQAIALTPSSAERGAAEGIEGSMRLVAAALERLDREVNGGPGPALRELVRCESILRSAVGRWRARVALGGGSLELRWRAGEATVEGDRDGLERAIDNLIVNAIEHGGPAIVVEGTRRGARLQVSVADSGSVSPPPEPPPGPVAYAGRRSGGRGRRGHGLAVVRRVAAEHGGRFVLRHSPVGSRAVLELPLGVARGPATHG
jgi:signal transduction histidine kinase